MSPRNLIILTTIVCAVALAFPLVGYGYLGGFTRYVADDFCSARNLALKGFWGSLAWTYLNHSGRFCSFLARISVQLIGGQRLVPFLGATVLILWLATTTWTLNQVAGILGLRQRLLYSFVLAELIIFAMLRTAPDPGQSFFWEDGNFTYTVPIILLTLYLGVCLLYLQAVSKGPRSAAILWLASILMFLGAGCSETNAALQCAGLLAAIFVCKWATSLPIGLRRSVPVLWAGFIGSLLSSILVVLAPGNAVREAGVRSVTPALPHIRVLTKSAWGSIDFLRDFLHDRPLAAFAMLAIPMALTCFQNSEQVSKVRWRGLIRAGLLGSAFSLFLIFSTILPAVFAFSTMPPGRALFATNWILLTSLVCAGIGIGTIVSPWFRGKREIFVASLAGALCLMLILPWTTRSIRNILAATTGLRRYALEWDNEDALLHQAKSHGNSDMVLPWNGPVASGGNVDGVPWLSSDPSFWVNKCTSDYYGVHTLRTITPSPSEQQMDGRD